MSGSRFVGSFAEAVRGWERTLNKVNETLDVWYAVQRKWMYLESIFVGAEDIRLQVNAQCGNTILVYTLVCKSCSIMQACYKVWHTVAEQHVTTAYKY
jgi:Dynein heavy chain, N-terminal region 2